jgi:5-(carboxyamino)imidazole ribonucleotide synthase
MPDPLPEAGPLPPGATIGIIGGGQLGRMSAMAAARLGYRVHIFSPEADSPAGRVAAAETVAPYDDLVALEGFAAAVDAVTFEFENVSADALSLLEARCPVRPSARVLAISQDRLEEKRFLNAAGIATAPWAAIETEADLAPAAARIKFPAVLKTTRLGYDGRGQARVHDPASLTEAFAKLAPKPLILEGFVDFACELSAIVARGADGAVQSFDAVENRHHHHILHATFAPARVMPEIARDAERAARKVAEALDLVGLLAVEFFLSADGRLLANEIAPRPHNSGHWTIEACVESQFALHIRAVAGLALPDPGRHADAVMLNLIGPHDMALWPALVATPGLSAHHYGKVLARPGRKMGHVTRLFPKGGLPGDAGVKAALAPLELFG